MSANDQVIVGPYPKDLTKFAVWHDYCVDNPFNFGNDPIKVCDTLEDAMNVAEEEATGVYPAEYGIRYIRRENVTEYVEMIWDEFPDYKYLGIVH